MVLANPAAILANGTIHGLVTVPGFLLLDQSDHPAPLYSVKGVHYLGTIEHGKQAFHRSLRVAAIFSQDAPSVLNGSNERILVGIVHDSHSPPLKDSREARPIRSGGALSHGPKGH
jgi:hypothetical protein